MAVISSAILNPSSGFQQGFDIYDAHFTGKERNRTIAERDAEQTFRAAQALVRTPPSGPTFLWVHFQDPHGPYTPARVAFEDAPPSYVGPDELPLDTDDDGVWSIPAYQDLGSRNPRDYVNLYDSEIRAVDDAVGKLVGELRRDEDAWKRSTVVLTADHGESLGEHGYFFAHGHVVYDELIHVPLLVKLPGTAKGSVSSQAVEQADILPTICAILAIPTPTPCRGRDLRSAHDGDVFSMAGAGDSQHPNSCIVHGDLKLLQLEGGAPLLVRHAGAEADEEKDLSSALPDDARALRAKLDAVKPLLALAPISRDLAVEEEREMRRLGYLQ